MNKMKAYAKKTAMVAVLMLLTAAVSLAQGPGGIGTGLDGGISPDIQPGQMGVAVPIDLNIVLLLAAGVVFSMLKAYARRKARPTA